MLGPGGDVLAIATERLAGPEGASLWPEGPPAASPPGGQNGLTVMRDLLSQEGRSERTHGRYLLRFTNGLGPKRRLRFMDQLPFFIQPLWHTFRAAIHGPGGTVEELSGAEAMRRLNLRLVASDGQRSPTEVYLEADVPAGFTVSVFLDVLKRFIQLREFSYAAEKGFDVSSAAWMEMELREEGAARGAAGLVSAALGAPAGDFVGSLVPLSADAASGVAAWKLRFTEGLIVLLPMPDFSMPFNVIALSSTAVTFFFGSIFRLTAAGRLPHWVMKKDLDLGSRSSLRKRLLLASLLAGLAALTQVEPARLQELRRALHPSAGPLVDLLEFTKQSLDEALGLREPEVRGGH
mmetsp:Transcript_53958/g.121977  ORF Transcript_53958/g.121977 Transcript_53958/m.121977 type:complete len:350 (+) Transcript_53958:2-1051(+)